MARKPIHLQAAGKLTPRDRIWAAIRTLHHLDPDGAGHFSLGDVADQVISDAPREATSKRIDESTIGSYLHCLFAGGYIAVDRPPRGGKGQWATATIRLVRDVGAEAPRLDAGGRDVTQGGVNANLWRAMKVLRAFDWRELRACAAVEISPATANGYCHMLARAGYLKILRPARPGTPASYRLVRDTGPRAPQIQRVKHVYDPNLGEVVWHPEASS